MRWNMERHWYAFYDQDVPRTIPYPNVTLKELFNHNAKNNSDKPNLIFKEIALPYRVITESMEKMGNRQCDFD
jgi:hypothetical protein